MFAEFLRRRLAAEHRFAVAAPFRPLRLQCLERRDLLSVAEFVAVPTVRVTGDAIHTVNTNDGVSYGSRYTLNAAAGYGPSGVDGRWGTTSGSFDVSGPLKIRIAPEEQELVGSDAIVSLDLYFTATGRGGAGASGRSAGRTEVTYGATFVTPTGTSSLISAGAGTPKVFDHCYTWETGGENIAYARVTKEFVVRVGDTVSLDLDLTGDSVAWQGGFTGVSCGFVNASLTLDPKQAFPRVACGVEVMRSGVGPLRVTVG